MIKTNNTPCTYEELYYEMWETAGRYSKITRFQVIGSSHDERLIPAVWVGNGNQTVFCIAGMIGTDRYMPGYLVEMIKEYTRAWECGWKLEEIYNLKDLFEKWTICFVPLLNPDGYEIYENDFFAIRNPIYRQMLRMQEVSCKEFTGNARGTELRKNFPTGYYRRKQIHQQPASENETKALVRMFQDDPGRGLLSFGYAGKRIVYFRQPQAFSANQKSYRMARHLQKCSASDMDKKNFHLEDVEPAGRQGYGSPEQFYAEICHQPAFRIEVPCENAAHAASIEKQTEYKEIHTLPLEYIFSL